MTSLTQPAILTNGPIQNKHKNILTDLDDAINNESGGTFVWQIWQIDKIHHQTFSRQLATFILFIIGCSVNLPNFLPPTCFERQLA